MSKIKLEYIWLDGNSPQCLRSKTKIVDSKDFEVDVTKLPLWSFDGSSTNQAEGKNSDLILKPVFMCYDPKRRHQFKSEAYLVMCEVMNPDGTPHKSNKRALIKEMLDEDESKNFWFAYEQEYFIWDTHLNIPLGFESLEGKKQGPYYCSVGGNYNEGRDIIVESHLQQCLDADLGIEGVNAEVAPAQWEFQIFSKKGAKDAGDKLWIARYLLERECEQYNGLCINWHCKPLGAGDWNGSGMHVNFSNPLLRDVGGEENFNKVCEAFGKFIKEHIAVYGRDNEQRLTGKHETASIDDFSYGVSDRGASIRIPISVIQNDWKGYLEDRRPNSEADPYEVAARIIETMQTVS